MKKLTLLLVVLGMSGFAIADDELPKTTTDGLTLIEDSKVSALYWLEGATLEEYNRVKILEAAVAFRKNWQRDYNRDAIGLTNRVDSSDMERIKASLAEEFNAMFTQQLEEGGYEVVDEVGEDVLLLRPAIINLDVTAPDLNTPSAQRSYASSAGSMTLYLELYDSATSAKIGLVMDAKAARDDGIISYSSRVTNKAEADRMLRKWADLLVAALDRAHEKD